MRTPEEVKKDLDAAEKEKQSLARRINDLEWELDCAKALQNLRGWVGFLYIDENKDLAALVFPIDNKAAKRSDFLFGMHDDKLVISHWPPDSPGSYFILAELTLGQQFKSAGFFATEPEAQNFVSDMQQRHKDQK